jgi:hypothetical protein
MSNLSSVTFKEVETAARMIAGSMDFTEPPSTVVMNWANMIIPELARLTSPIDKPWGRNTTTLSNLKAEGKFIARSSGGSYTYATKTLAKSALALDQTYVGGLVFLGWDSTDPRVGSWSIIESVASDGASCVFKTDPVGADISSAETLAFIKPKPWAHDGAHLGSVSVFDIVKVVDGTNGNFKRLEPHEFASFEDGAFNDDSLAIEYMGETLHWKRGNNITSFSTVTTTYDEKPTAVTLSTSTIDLQDWYIPTLIDELAVYILSYLNKEIPQDVGNKMREIEEHFKKSAKNVIDSKTTPAKRS